MEKRTRWIGLLGQPEQNTTDQVTYTVETHFLTVLEVHDHGVSRAGFLGLSACLIDVHPLPVSSHGLPSVSES